MNAKLLGWVIRSTATFASMRTNIFLSIAAFSVLCLISFGCSGSGTSKAQSENTADGLIKDNSRKPEGKSKETSSEAVMVRPSDILDELRKRAAEQPKLKPTELADFGNRLLPEKGYNFTLDPSEFKNVIDNKYDLFELTGKQTTFQLQEPEGSPCFDVLKLPVEKINTETMVVVSDGIKYALKRPKTFYTEQFALVDSTLKKVIREWAAPIDATPAGISKDGKNVYVEFDFSDNDYEQELQIPSLLIEISEQGVIRFIARDDPRIKRGKELEGYPTIGEISYRKFNTGKQHYIVRFSYPCT